MKIRYVENKKGITLIALIITIILMLILAGVVLNLTIGENGIIKFGKKAGEEYKISSAKEKIELAVMDYEAKMRKETIYSILDKIEGLESIEPDDEKTGLPYTVTVDGYKFLVKEGIEVIYQEKATGIIPEIVSITKNVISQTQAKINIEAKTKDSEGIEKLILIKNGVAIEEKEVNGKSIKEEFSATGNGQYKIKVIGKNKRRAISKEIQISEMNIGSAEITSGEVIEGKAVLTITGDYGKQNITKVEIYEGENKVKEIPYKEGKSKIEEEYETQYMPFYEEKTYTAKIIVDEKNETTTNELKIQNSNAIKTEEDLKKLASVVSEGENFERKTIKKIEEINLTKEHIAIGTITAPFKGTYNGQENRVNNIQINDTTLENQGLFGYIENATIKNIILGEGNINAGNKLGGVVGYAKDSTIDNIINNKTSITANTIYYENYNTLNDFGTTISQWNNVSTNSAGGICGLAQNTNINNSMNSANIIGVDEVWATAGIVGYINGENTKVTSCTNTGSVTNGWAMGGIVGVSDGNVVIERCKNKARIQHYGDGIGGIGGVLVGGKIIECQNENSIEGHANIGGIVGFAIAKELSSNFEIISCSNSGTVTSRGYNTTSIYSIGSDATWNTCATGGIIGYGIKLKVTSCYNTNQIIGGKDTSVQVWDVGGIAGAIRNSEVTKCYNIGTIKGGAEYVGSVGGIVGTGFYNVKVNNSYNEGEISGYNAIGGVVGIGNMIDVRYCYNKGTITTTWQCAGGVVGHVQPWNATGYENLIYYCYNKGNVVAPTREGSINGYFIYLDTDYVYSLEGITQTNSNWGGGEYYINATKQGIFDKETLRSTVLSEFGENFKQDYENEESVNDGFPILTWQVERSKMPKQKNTVNQ